MPSIEIGIRPTSAAPLKAAAPGVRSSAQYAEPAKRCSSSRRVPEKCYPSVHYGKRVPHSVDSSAAPATVSSPRAAQRDEVSRSSVVVPIWLPMSS